MKRILILIAILVLSIPAWGLDIDLDDNSAVDVVYGGTNSTTASDARTALGLAIGTDVQAYDATILKNADIGVSVQSYDADLDAASSASAVGATANGKYFGTDAAGVVGFHDAAIGGGTSLTDGTSVGDMLAWDGDSYEPVSSLGTIEIGGLSASMAVHSTPSGILASHADVSSTELGYINGLTGYAKAATTKSTSTTYTIGTTDANEAYGGIIYVTGACVVTAPAIAAGMSFTLITIGDIAVSLDVNASDKMILDGVTLADGDKATNTSKAGDLIVCSYYSADGWYCASGSNLGTLWSDGN